MGSNFGFCFSYLGTDEETDASIDLPESSAQITFLQKSLLQLNEHADILKGVLLRRDVCNEPFVSLNDTLTELQKTLLHLQLAPHCEIFQQLSDLLLNIISDLLEGE